MEEETVITAPVMANNTAIYRLPPEIWEKVFNNLLSSQDCENVTKVAPYFQNILKSSKSSWLFQMVFPFLLPYLNKTEIFSCRVISKRWCFAVDDFLINNAYHRPASSEYFLKDRVLPLATTLCAKKLAYNDFTSARKIAVALNQRHKPPYFNVVGKSACIKETMATLGQRPGNVDFLKYFGRDVYFLKLAIANLSPVNIVRRILELVMLVPNLRKLDIFGGISPQFVERTGFRKSKALQELAIFSRVKLSDRRIKKRLPQLETLDCEITGPCHAEMKRFLFQLFSNSKKFQSLAMNLMPINANSEFRLLADLSLSVESESQLTCIRTLKAPLRRIMLHVTGFVNTSDLLAIPRDFKETMCNFGVHIPRDFYMKTSEDRSLADQRKPFTCSGIWQDLKLLSRISLKGNLPLSLNFLCGLKKNLEWLHIAQVDEVPCDSVNFRQWRERFESVKRGLEEPERLDLLPEFSDVLSGNEAKMKEQSLYSSRVWEMFPKLKGVTIRTGQRRDDQVNQWQERKYDRDSYDRSQKT